MTEPLPPLTFAAPWTIRTADRRGPRACLMLGHRDGRTARVEVRRCGAGRLRDSYPVGAHDIEIAWDEPPQPTVVEPVLRAVLDAVWAADPRCRKVVYAADRSEGDIRPADESVLGAVAAAGFRHVVDVDVPGAELSLWVAEPDRMREKDFALDTVPGT